PQYLCQNRTAPMDKKKMKPSERVTAALVTSVAAMITVGCGSGKHCEDSMGRVIPSSECSVPTGAYTYPHWVYSSRSGYYAGTHYFPTSTYHRYSSGPSGGTSGGGSGARGGFGAGSGGGSSASGG